MSMMSSGLVKKNPTAQGNSLSSDSANAANAAAISTPPPVASPIVVSLKQEKPPRLRGLLVIKNWCRRSDSRPNIPLCRFVSGSVPLSILNTVPIVDVAPYRRV